MMVSCDVVRSISEASTSEHPVSASKGVADACRPGGKLTIRIMRAPRVQQLILADHCSPATREHDEVGRERLTTGGANSMHHLTAVIHRVHRHVMQNVVDGAGEGGALRVGVRDVSWKLAVRAAGSSPTARRREPDRPAGDIRRGRGRATPVPVHAPHRCAPATWLRRRECATGSGAGRDRAG